MPSKGAILITGACGLVGANLVRHFVAKGERVVAYDNQFLGTWKQLEGVDCIKVDADCLDAKALEKAARDHKVDRAVHLAGYTSAPMFDEEPGRKVIDSIRMFVNLLEIARVQKIKVAYAATSSFYARCPKPFREDMHIVPATPYELSKFSMEQAAHTYNLQFGVVANGLRFFSVYGPHESHKGRFANNISQFYWSLKNDVPPVIFGDGSQTRDFTYVGDLVKAIDLVLAKAKGSEVYNIGTGTEFSFNEMVKLINQALGKSIPPIYVKNPLKNYVQETRADTSKIERDLGWKATTTLKEGIGKIVKFNEPFTKAQAQALYSWIR